jgi:hypothetical protein
MTKRAAPGSTKSQTTRRVFCGWALNGAPSPTRNVAFSLAVSALTLMPLPAGAAYWSWMPHSDFQGNGNEASTTSRGALAAARKPSPKLAQASEPTMPDEAPHITPAPAAPTEGQPAPRMAQESAPNQPTMPDEAPHITPTTEAVPGTTTTQAPPE